MTIYWQSTKAPVHMFKRDYESPELAKHISENSFIDAAILASEVGLSTDAVKAYQRRLGVRKVAQNNPTPTRRWGSRGTVGALRGQEESR